MHVHIGLKHKRIRKEQEQERLSRQGLASAPPPQTKYLIALDKITFVAGIVGPFTVIPQVYEIFSTHQAAGVSTISWVLMSIVTLPWIFYGVAHKDKTIIVSFILWEIVNLMVVAGALIY